MFLMLQFFLGDFLVFIDLKVVLPIQKWSNAISENFFDAFSYLFQVGIHSRFIKIAYFKYFIYLQIPPGNVNVLADRGYTYAFIGEKIQVQLRLPKSEYSSVSSLTSAGQSIVQTVNDASFAEALIASLNKTSSENDGLDYSRYGWMTRRHIQVFPFYFLFIF
jgi:hypothetical protein